MDKQAGETERSDTTAREIAQLVEQVAQAAASVQSASQTAQQVNQAVSDLAQKLSSQATQVLQEETGFAERLQTAGVDNQGVLFANVKRTYDEYQQESLESIKRNRSYVDKVLSDAQTHDNDTRKVALQALQNAVETANMVGKQAVRHSDIAIDHEWNLEPSQGAAEGVVLRAVTIDDASLKAIGAVVAAAVAQALAGNKE
jgi:cell division septum initiation protein DivIVA